MSYNPLAFTASPTVTAGAEQVLVTTPTVSAVPTGGFGNLINFTIFHTPNATPGTVQYRVRANSLTGTVIYASASTQVPGTASVPTELTFNVLDPASATTAGTTNYVVTANYTNQPAAVTVTGFVVTCEDQD